MHRLLECSLRDVDASAVIVTLSPSCPFDACRPHVATESAFAVELMVVDVVVDVVVDEGVR